MKRRKQGSGDQPRVCLPHLHMENLKSVLVILKYPVYVWKLHDNTDLKAE